METYRLYSSLTYQNEKDDFSSFSLGVGYDYLFRNSSDFTPFLGGSVSYMWGKVSDEDETDKPKGFNYGLEGGVLYAITNNIELEIGARYMFSNVDDSANYSDQWSSGNFKIELDNYIQYYLGLNYKF